MRRTVLPALAVLVLTACGDTAPPATPPSSAPAAVDSPLCDDLRTAARGGTPPEDARNAATRVLEQAAGGSDGVLPADVEAGLRERADGRSPSADRTAAVQRFVQEQCG